MKVFFLTNLRLPEKLRKNWFLENFLPQYWGNPPCLLFWFPQYWGNLNYNWQKSSLASGWSKLSIYWLWKLYIRLLMRIIKRKLRKSDFLRSFSPNTGEISYSYVMISPVLWKFCFYLEKIRKNKPNRLFKLSAGWVGWDWVMGSDMHYWVLAQA